MNIYTKALQYYRKNWHWLNFVALFLGLSLAMGLYMIFGERWVDVVQGLLNVLTSGCLPVLIAIPIAVALIGAILAVLK
jgi:polyferredoxin